MEITKIKIEGYMFEKEERVWVCKNHNLMSGDIEIINQIMPKLKDIEKILEGNKK